ncbi:MAG TPA: hypothetical protein VN847_00700, partial [Streptosporangiaceae bacterium]|nr:hypothetical protein [Streptosporangiaceae bacterium]
YPRHRAAHTVEPPGRPSHPGRPTAGPPPTWSRRPPAPWSRRAARGTEPSAAPSCPGGVG